MTYETVGLQNGNVGGKWDERWSVRFKAHFSSPLAAIRFYVITKNGTGKVGYAGGSGGKYTYQLCADSLGIPGTILDSGYIVTDSAFVEWTNNGGFPLVVFPKTPLLTIGSNYHFLMTNVDTAPLDNYESMDFLISKTGKNPDPDYSVMYQAKGGPWKTYDSLIASPFGIFYANGLKQGNGGYQLAPDGSTQVAIEYGFGGL